MKQMDCDEIRELLDAYALGASESGEVKAIEEHVADCVRCWDELSAAQATAALLALSVPIEPAPEHLERKIMAQAQREAAPATERKSFWRRWGLNAWPATAGAFGAVSVVALALSGLLLLRVQDVQSKNSDLETQIQAATFAFQKTSELTNNQQAENETVFSILSDGEHQEVEMKSAGDSASQAYYTWSPSKQMGVVICEDMPALQAGEVYEVWFQVNGEDHAVKPFISDDGGCQVTMDLAGLHGNPDGIGITVESAPGATVGPSKPWLMWGEFPTYNPAGAAH